MFSHDGLYLCRQRPTLPHTFAYSTIGPAGLNFRVRDGNGWFPRGKITDNLLASRNLQRANLVKNSWTMPQLNRLGYFQALVLCQSDFTLAWLALHKFYGQAERAISTGKLKPLLVLHTLPIKHVVFVCPSSPFWVGRSNLEECFPLICIQRLSQPNFATQLCHWHDNWNTRGSSIPVLSY